MRPSVLNGRVIDFAVEEVRDVRVIETRHSHEGLRSVGGVTRVWIAQDFGIVSHSGGISQ